MNILVTHVSYHAAINMVKLLKRINSFPIEVWGCSSYPRGLSCGSMVVDHFFQAPPMKNENEYIAFIQKLVNDHAIGFILTPDEDELLLFREHINFFKARTILPSTETLQLFTHKLNATKAMEKLGIPTPAIITSGVPAEELAILRENHSSGSVGITVAPYNDLKDLQNDENFLQQYIKGTEYTVDILCDRSGVPHQIVPRQRIAIRNGITYRCKVEKQDEIIELCRRIYEKHYLPGITNVQFIVHNGVPYFLELNPRFGGTSIASSLVSFNWIEGILLHFAMGSKLEQTPEYTSPIRWNAVIARYYEETIYHQGEY